MLVNAALINAVHTHSSVSYQNIDAPWLSPMQEKTISWPHEEA
jgi:hypothetical protein